jgi:hypothetical protein
MGAGIVFLSLMFLGYFVYKNRDAFTAHRWQLNYAFLASTLPLHLGAFAIAIGTWHLVISRLAGASDLRFNAKVFCYSAVARRVPGVAWDIATRIVMYNQAGISKAIAGVASVLEYLLINLAGIVYYVALTPFVLAYTRLSSWLLAGAVMLGLVLTHPRLITAIVRRLRSSAVPVSLRYRDTVTWLLIYMLSWTVGGLILFAVVRSIWPLSSVYVLQVTADWTLAGVLTAIVNFVPAGLGLKEVTLTLLMSRYMPEHVAVTSAILMRVLMTGYSVLWMLLSTRL